MKILDICKDDRLKKYEFYANFLNSKYFSLMKDALRNLNTDVLFKSKIHGQDHIERVIFFSAILSWYYKLSEIDTKILLLSSSYHDIERINDGYDTAHGMRASKRLHEFSNLDDESLEIAKVAVRCHSLDDKYMKNIIDENIKKDQIDRAYMISKLFKDSDGLDRVRISDLDQKFLRNDFSKQLIDFSNTLFNLYGEYNGLQYNN